MRRTRHPTTLRDLFRRATLLRDQVIAAGCAIVLVDVLWVFALIAWFHRRSGRSALAVVTLVGVLACVILVTRQLRREQRDVLAAIRHALGPEAARSVDR